MAGKVEVASRGLGVSEQQSGSLRTKSIFLRLVLGQITEMEECSFREDREEVWNRDTTTIKDHQSGLLSTRLIKLLILKISVIAMRSITHPFSKYLLNTY